MTRSKRPEARCWACESLSDVVRCIPDPQYFQELLAGNPAGAELLYHLSQLPRQHGAMTILPDLELEPRSRGASGVVVRTLAETGYIFPLLVPDAGCGFRVMTLSDEECPQQRDALVNTVKRCGSQESSERTRVARAICMPEVFKRGVGAMADLGLSDPSVHDRIDEGGACCDADPTPLLSDPAVIGLARRNFARAGGHFFCIRKVARVHDVKKASCWGIRGPGALVVTIHSGAMALVSAAVAYFAREKPDIAAVPPSACLAARRAGIGYCLNTGSGSRVYGVVRALMNYAYASRSAAAALLGKALACASSPKPHSVLRLLVDSAHSAISPGMSGGKKVIEHRRGVQRVLGADWAGSSEAAETVERPAFIAGGREGWCFLVSAGRGSKSVDGLCPHGIPSWQPPADGAADWLSQEELLSHVYSSYSDSGITPPAARHAHTSATRMLHALLRKQLVTPVATLAPWVNIDAFPC